MIEDLEKIITHIRSEAHTDKVGALEAATDLVEKYPRNAKVWSLRSYVYTLLKRYADAVQDVTEAISIDPSETAYYFNRGRYLVDLKRYKESVSDFSRGIELCDIYSNDYYRQTLHFLRAFAYLKIGEKEAAMNDLTCVKIDDFAIWVDGLVSKEQLLDAARS